MGLDRLGRGRRRRYPTTMTVQRVPIDPGLTARILRRSALRYRDGADPMADRPGHVRAASALAWVGDRLVIVQDDANFLALADPFTDTEADTNRGSVGDAHADAVHLPAGHEGRRQFDEGRGNKAHKLDLESCITFGSGSDTTLVAFGSGSTAAREQILVATDLVTGDPTVEVVPARELYASLRTAADFAGSELNIEGAVLLGDRELRLFGRGNGAARDGRVPTNATCTLDWAPLWAWLRDRSLRPPTPHSIVRYDLGTIDGVPLGFTDAMARSDGILFSAAAEASPDAVQDGVVSGSVLGIIPAHGEPRCMRVLDERGEAFTGKIEGVTAGARAGTVHVVVDEDDPSRPSELCEVGIEGT